MPLLPRTNALRRLVAAPALAALAFASPLLAHAHAVGGVPHLHDDSPWGALVAAVTAGCVAWIAVQQLAHRRAERRQRPLRIEADRPRPAKAEGRR